MSREERPSVPHFCEALRQNDAALRALPYSTRQRRLDGWLPPIFDWLLDYPDLIVALAEDASARQAAPQKDAA